MFNTKLTMSIAEAVKKVVDEELTGKQHKIDVNKNNKIDAEDFKHLRAGKKPVAEAMSKADVPTIIRKKMGEKPLTMADVKAAPKDSISHPDNLAKARGAVKEEIEEFEMLDEEQLDELDSSTLKSYAKKANKQLNTLNKVVDSNRGKLPKPVNKAISQQQQKRDVGIERANSKISDRAMGIKKEETEQLDELSPGTLKSYVNKAKPEVKAAKAERSSAEMADDYKTASDSQVTIGKRESGIKQAKAKLNKEETEQIQEYQSKGGVYKHKGTYGTEKSTEAGYTDYDKENEMAKKNLKTKAPRKLGARQNFVRSKRVNEGFSSMLNAYEEGGIRGLFESFIKEEPTNDEYKAELEKQKAKAAGKAPQADVSKASVQAVKNEEVEQLDEKYTVGEKTPNKQGGHNQDVHYMGKKIGHIESYSHRTGTRYGSHHQASGDGSAGMRSHAEAMADLKDAHKDHMSSVNEEVEQLDELSPGTLKSYVNKAKPEVKAAKAERHSAEMADDYKTASDSQVTIAKRQAGMKAAKAKLNAEEVEQVEERSLTEPEMKKKEEVVKSMKKGIQGFKDRYGSDAKSVMYATATKIAKKD